MSVTLSDEQTEAARRLAARAGFAQVTDYLSDLLDREELQASLEESGDDADAGRVRPAEEFFQVLAAKYNLKYDDVP